MVHDVVPDFTPRGHESVRKACALRVEEDLRGAERGGIQEDDARLVLALLLRVRVDHTHTRDTSFLLVVEYALDDRVGHDRHAPRVARRRKRRAQAAEVAGKAAAARTLISRLTGTAA